MVKRTPFLVLVLEGVVFIELVNLSLSDISGWGIDSDYCDIEWVALDMNRDHSVFFETAHKYCISDSSVDYEGYSISSKRFLLTVSSVQSPSRV